MTRAFLTVAFLASALTMLVCLALWTAFLRTDPPESDTVTYCFSDAVKMYPVKNLSERDNYIVTQCKYPIQTIAPGATIVITRAP